MPMKLSLILGKPRPLSKETAWGCFTTNLAAPGCGSLYAGKPVGYLQLAFYMTGFVMTLIFGLQTLLWYINDFSKTQESGDMSGIFEIWVHFRWPLLGLAMSAFGFMWALISRVGILREAKDSLNGDDTKPLPPLLHRK